MEESVRYYCMKGVYKQSGYKYVQMDHPVYATYIFINVSNTGNY